jgi:hypothetical protein
MNGQPSGWAIGWTAFAGVLMVMLGVWWIVAGIVAIADDDFFVIAQEWVFKFSTTTWGWIHLGLGIVILLSGIGLFTANVWARTVGVVLALIAGLVAFAWLPWYPVWAIIFIAAAVAVIWALTAHGHDIVEA